MDWVSRAGQMRNVYGERNENSLKTGKDMEDNA